MGGSYRQCTQCGKRALSIATRCPGCGREFEDPIVPETGGIGELRRFLTPGTLTLVLAILAVLAVAQLGRTVRPAEQSGFAAAESLSDSAEVASSLAATTRPEPSRAARGDEDSRGRLLVARDWTNVRKARTVRAPLEAMLMPGDTVLADSLERDWYRVALEGEVLGYAHRTTLAAPGATRAPAPRGAGRPE